MRRTGAEREIREWIKDIKGVRVIDDRSVKDILVILPLTSPSPGGQGVVKGLKLTSPREWVVDP